MIIQYASDEDKLAAELIQRKIGGSIYRGYIDPAALSDNIVMVGGQIANPTYNAFMNLGILPEVTEGTPGTVFVSSYSGYNVYACAGWDRTGTIAAAEYVYLNGLPVSSVIAGDIGELYFYEIRLREAMPGAFSGLISKLTQFRANISDKLPPGYSIDYANLNDNTLEILIRKDVGAMDLVVSISFLILIILALVALSIFVWVVGISVSKIVGGITESIAKKNASELLDEKYRSGEITYDQYIKGMETLWGKIDWKNIILWAILLAGIGIGSYFVIKGLMPAIRAKILTKEG